MISTGLRSKLSKRLDACILDRPCSPECGHRHTPNVSIYIRPCEMFSCDLYIMTVYTIVPIHEGLNWYKIHLEALVNDLSICIYTLLKCIYNCYSIFLMCRIMFSCPGWGPGGGGDRA